MKRTGYIAKLALFAAAFGYFSPEVSAQQLGSYLQYQTHTEQINSAYSLTSDDAKIYTIGRKQWAGIQGAPTTILAGGHLKTSNDKAAVGFNFLYDKIGPEQYTEAGAYYAYGLRLSDNDYLGASVNAGVRFYRARLSLLEDYDQALRDDINERVATVGLSFMYYRPEQLYFGVALPRIGGEQFKDVQAFREDYGFSAAYLFTVDQGFHVKASTWVSVMKDRDALTNVSAMAYFSRKIGLGVNYATSKDFGLLASFATNSKLRFGYGYQFGVAGTTMAGPRNGTHEISLSYHFSKDGLIKLL